MDVAAPLRILHLEDSDLDAELIEAELDRLGPAVRIVRVMSREAFAAEAVPGRHEIKTASIFVDAPLDISSAFLGDLRNFAEWAYFIKPDGEAGPNGGRFRDEYGQPVDVEVRTHDFFNYVLLEFAHHYREQDLVQRNLMFLVPTAYAFGSPKARGVIQHRVAFFEKGSPPAHGKLQIEDYGAEAMSLKRVLEHKAGNLSSFNRGMSYLPEAAA